jgi:hypothetical protein
VKTKYHREITTMAVGEYFSLEALEEVISANLGQDALRYQIGHDHFHYDSNSFSAGDSYCNDLRQMIPVKIRSGNISAARIDFGCLTHTVQDFYAHSNFVALWRESYPNATPEEIDPESAVFLSDPRLHSGKLYYPLEILSFVNILKGIVLPLLPRDSHAWMNMDDPFRPNFDFAFSAAVKRTRAEYQRVVGLISSTEAALLTGVGN